LRNLITPKFVENSSCPEKEERSEQRKEGMKRENEAEERRDR
jgi:hypothetical protein